MSVLKCILRKRLFLGAVKFNLNQHWPLISRANKISNKYVFGINNIIRETTCNFSKFAKNKPVSLESQAVYEQVAEETLQSIAEGFEDLLENSPLVDWDVNYSNGVLKISIEKHGVYVLNKQTPNRQIWLSSPVSGPKRYDYVNGTWIYRHDERALHDLLSTELSDILQMKVNFKSCSFCNL